MHLQPSSAATRSVSIGDGLTVNRLGYGAVRLLGRLGRGAHADDAGCRATLRQVPRLGINFIDTSDAYGPHLSERMIADELHPYNNLLIATKGGIRMGIGKDEVIRDGRPDYLRSACDGSLKRLKVETIDLYQLHHVDPRTPIEESVGCLADLRREGKIRNIGLSNVTVEQIEAARGVAPIATVQNRYNLSDRVWESVLDHCEAHGIVFIAWHPLAMGELPEVRGSLDRIAREREVLPASIALAWILTRSPMTLPIPGTTSVAHLVENVNAADIRLSGEEMAALEAVPKKRWEWLANIR